MKKSNQVSKKLKLSLAKTIISPLDQVKAVGGVAVTEVGCVPTTATRCHIANGCIPILK